GISEGLINGTFKDVLSFGVYIGMIVPLFFGLFLSLKGAVRLLPLLLSLVGMYMIFVIGSRSGLLCVWVSVLVFAVLFLGRISVRKSWNKRSSIFILGGASLVLLGFLAVTALFFLSDGKILKSKTLERWSPILQQRARGSATSPRFHLWKNAALMMKDYPLSGTGIGSYIIEVPNYAQIHHVPIIAPQSAENYLLQVGSELGAAGLIFVLWIFWEIIRQMKRRYAASLVNDKSGFILIGAMAGIASYFVNIQFHTYIGSYEIKYMFWLLVAVLFCCRPNDESRERKSFFASKINLLSILLIVVFAGVHLWNSTHSLSLKRRTEMFDLTQYFGLSKKEVTAAGEEFQWTGSYGGKTIRITGSVMILPLLASHPDIGDNPVTVRISTTTDFFREKTVLKEVVMDTGGWREYELDVASKVGLKVILLVEVNRTWNPQKVMGTSDPRNLGVAIGTIRFKGKPVS
ncbi:MAG: O-antigen ligase family protein, partial [Candidatus Aminicenantes bacterium]|nr:O-antigen ligase family protein [Candidatus Aminicenantes bacterium]